MMRAVLFRLGLGILTILISACSSGATEIREFEVGIHSSLGGHVSMDPDLIEAKQNDLIILRITSHQKGMLHLHGYDLALMVDVDSTAVLEFDAAITGRFEMMFHVVVPEVGANSENSHGDSSHISEEHGSGKIDQSVDQLLGYLQVIPR